MLNCRRRRRRKANNTKADQQCHSADARSAPVAGMTWTDSKPGGFFKAHYSSLIRELAPHKLDADGQHEPDWSHK